jgi:threonine/homoserine/homoserine lactone efflux protein
MSMELRTWLIYMLAVVGLSLTPGPNSLLVLAHGALHGHRKTIWTVAGGAVGFVTLIALSMLGISAILQAYASALTLLKWAGGAYLCWLGLQLWLAPALVLDVAVSANDARKATLFRQGLLAAISNPKVLLFYGAFLPQFIDPSRSLWTQFVVMALTFSTIECSVEFLLARMAHNIRPALNRAGNKFNRVCGVLFGLMGAALPLTN